jgi:hypothetical protein
MTTRKSYHISNAMEACSGREQIGVLLDRQERALGDAIRAAFDLD